VSVSLAEILDPRWRLRGQIVLGLCYLARREVAYVIFFNELDGLGSAYVGADVLAATNRPGKSIRRRTAGAM
jgi:hypothetical protein